MSSPEQKVEKKLKEIQQLANQKQLDKALTKALALLEQYHKSFPSLYCTIGTLYAQNGELEKAKEYVAKSTRALPNYTFAHLIYAELCKKTDDKNQALASFKEVLRLEPNNYKALTNLGVLLGKSAYYVDAIPYLQKSLAMQPRNETALISLGDTYSKMGETDNALEQYEKALALNPDNVVTLNSIGALYKNIGEFEKALEYHEMALGLQPAYIANHFNLVQLKKFLAEDPQIEMLSAMLEDKKKTTFEQILLNFALGKMYDDLGRYDEAFHYFKNGNQLRKEQLDYDIANEKRPFESIKSIFSVLETKEEKSCENGKNPFIFIVGMPRSGTSLAEQILSSHSTVMGMGETETLKKLAENHLETLPQGTGSSRLVELSQNIMREYVRIQSGLFKGSPVRTEKMPINFKWIGVILMGLPEAKVINLVRNPVAVCWSNYRTFFPNKGNGFAYDLNDLRDYYALYADLMDFWRQKFPGRIYDLHYEDLTENQEEETRKLLEYCDLSWEEQCLDFHKTKRSINTASALQVRQKIYKGSSEVWKHYEKYLEPLFTLQEA